MLSATGYIFPFCPPPSDEKEIDDGPVTGWGGHATQILWKDTTELGCAMAACERGGNRYNTLVCNYNPP